MLDEGSKSDHSTEINFPDNSGNNNPIDAELHVSDPLFPTQEVHIKIILVVFKCAVGIC